MSKNKTYVEITDMPTDKYQALGKLRPILVGVYNKCRDHSYKMTLLKHTLKFMYNKCVAFESHMEELANEEKKVAANAALAAKTAAKPVVKAEIKPKSETKTITPKETK
tara:strand:- start:2532 stop:2858 length:327 start_codon:yes stop_codon:yes gene_type:complete